MTAQEASETPSYGRMEGDEHVLSVRVYYEDTDAAGIVYHSNYLKFAERGRTELLRLAGISQAELVKTHGMAFAVRDCALDYRAPAWSRCAVPPCARSRRSGAAARIS